MAEAAHHYKFDITMTCSGCSGAVERVLKKTEGLSATLVSATQSRLPTHFMLADMLRGAQVSPLTTSI